MGWEGRLWSLIGGPESEADGSLCMLARGHRGDRDTKNVHLHTLNAGHWVHVDDPEGLLRLVGPTFAGR